MKIAEGLEVLQITNTLMGAAFFPTLIYDDRNAVLVDTSIPGNTDIIKNEASKAGVSISDLTHIILTHQDIDHMGCVADIQKEPGNKVIVVTHEEEKPYVEFEKMPIKLTPALMAEFQKRFGSSEPGVQKSPQEAFGKLKVRVDKTVQDGEEIPVCGGITVIFTPGHTPGHICLYLKKYKVLIAGDAMNVQNGELIGPNPVATYNMDQAKQSLKKLTPFDIKTVVCHHGGIYDKNVNQRIAQLAEEK